MKKFVFDIQRFVETISGTEGHDNISVTASQQFINALGGNDTVFNAFTYSYQGNNYGFVTISGGDGADSIKSGSSNNNQATNNVSIIGGAGNDWVSVVGSNATISGDYGDDYISARNNSNSINGGAGDDYIVGEGSNITIRAENGNDTVYVSNSDHAFIEGSDGADSLIAGGTQSYQDGGGIGITINGGTGNDYIRSKTNTNGSMIGGNGDDTILALGSPQNLTINGGYGNDLISLESGVNALIYFNSLDNNDIVYGFNENDTLQISGSSYSTTASDNNVIVNIGSGTINLIGATGKSLNIVSTNSSSPSTSTTQNETSTPTVKPSTGNTPQTSVSGNYSHYIIQKSNNVYTYGTGNRTITSYAQNEIVRLDDYQGLDDISGNNFYIKSKSGRLEIQNSHGKWIGYSAFNSEVIAYSYVASNSGNVDGRLKDQAKILIGAHNKNNSIVAGDGDASLWGGNGGNDTMTGGDGRNEFYYTIGNGNDVIKDAEYKDLVNLLGVSLNQITGYSSDSNSTTLQFSDGGSLRVEGSSIIDYLIDGQKYWYSRSTKRMIKS